MLKIEKIFQIIIQFRKRNVSVETRLKMSERKFDTIMD
jgi:hypothetical protein